MIIKLINFKIYRNNLKDLIFSSDLFSILLLRNFEPLYTRNAYQNSISGILVHCKLVHTSRCNQWINYSRYDW